MLKRYRTEGRPAIGHQASGKAPPNKAHKAKRNYAVALVNENYEDFGPRLPAEVLAERHGFKASRECVHIYRGLSAAGLAIAWLLAQGDHIIPIPGTRSLAHFAELLLAAERSLSADDLKAIDAVLPIGWAHSDCYSAV